jgi:hypothetical protein
MYGRREMMGLGARKADLRRRIALTRLHCAQDATEALRPVEWLDRMLAFWHGLSPLVRLTAVPLGLIAARAVAPRRTLLAALFRWAPVAAGVLRGLHSRS